MIIEAQKEIDEIQIKLKEEADGLRWIASNRGMREVVRTEIIAQASAIERHRERLRQLCQYLEDSKNQ